jgi:16S rRNA (cytosine967-C5)-methyltransferase
MGVGRGAFSSDLLARDAAHLDSRDAGLAEEIALGVLRWRGAIDFLIEKLAGRPVRKMDAEVVAALRMGVYQLRWLDRIPAHAAINESVELIKRARKRSATGFANAVLRKITRDPVEWPDEATRLSCPQWILDRWTSHYGADVALKIAEANLRRPERFVRLGPSEPVPEGLQPTEVPGAYIGDTGSQSRVQDISSQCIVPLLDLHPGQTFLDLCSAPGNKTAQALETAVRGIAAVSESRSWLSMPLCPSRSPRSSTESSSTRPALAPAPSCAIPRSNGSCAPRISSTSRVAKSRFSATRWPRSRPADGWFIPPVHSNPKRTRLLRKRPRPAASVIHCSGFRAGTGVTGFMPL